MVVVLFFFFQAEDGIRDLVRSRGLGDVYKRQDPGRAASELQCHFTKKRHQKVCDVRKICSHQTRSVSYTHLTLPTSDLV